MFWEAAEDTKQCRERIGVRWTVGDGHEMPQCRNGLGASGGGQLVKI